MKRASEIVAVACFVLAESLWMLTFAALLLVANGGPLSCRMFARRLELDADTEVPAGRTYDVWLDGQLEDRTVSVVAPFGSGAIGRIERHVMENGRPKLDPSGKRVLTEHRYGTVVVQRKDASIEAERLAIETIDRMRARAAASIRR